MLSFPNNLFLNPIMSKLKPPNRGCERANPRGSHKCSAFEYKTKTLSSARLNYYIKHITKIKASYTTFTKTQTLMKMQSSKTGILIDNLYIKT